MGLEKQNKNTRLEKENEREFKKARVISQLKREEAICGGYSDGLGYL